MAQRLNVLYQFDEGYAPFAGTSMVSLFRNNRDLEEICVYVLGEHLTDATKDRFLGMVRRYERAIRFVDTAALVRRMQQMGIPDYRGSYASNFKMFLPELLRQDQPDRILYIDSDTLITGSLAPLLTWPMNGQPVAMAYDSLGRRHARLIGLQPGDSYFNAGVILFDVRRWRQMNCTDRIVEHVRHVRAHYMAPDQDLLNVVLHGQIALLPPEYNFQPIHTVCGPTLYGLLFRPKNYYTSDQLRAASRSLVIHHFFRFLGEFPWHADTLHPDREIFDTYLALSPWAEYERVPASQSGLVFRLERWMYRFLPRWLFLLIFKIAYDAFINRCWRDSEQGKNNDWM